MHYGTTVLYCVVYFHLFNCHYSPYPRKLNDNEKLWIYGMYTYMSIYGMSFVMRSVFFQNVLYQRFHYILFLHNFCATMQQLRE